MHQRRNSNQNRHHKDYHYSSRHPRPCHLPVFIQNLLILINLLLAGKGHFFLFLLLSIMNFRNPFIS